MTIKTPIATSIMGALMYYVGFLDNEPLMILGTILMCSSLMMFAWLIDDE